MQCNFAIDGGSGIWEQAASIRLDCWFFGYWSAGKGGKHERHHSDIFQPCTFAESNSFGSLGIGEGWEAVEARLPTQAPLEAQFLLLGCLMINGLGLLSY